MDLNEIRVRLWGLINDPSKKDEFNELWHQLTGQIDGLRRGESIPPESGR